MPEHPPVRLFNSLHRQAEVFGPRRGTTARIYTCGPTVYNYAHLGNMRAYVFADILRRTLQWKGLDVMHVINITDVGHLTSDADEGEDKVEVAARAAHSSAYEITQKYTEAFFADLASLNVQPAALYCRATRNIQEMIDFVQVLEERGVTYELADGLYFDTAKVRNYGQLGALDLEAQLPGARVAADPGKRHPWDFSLWRRSPRDAKRLMEWESPWGRGFPGWHLECSVMSLKYLSGPFDIHTGGVDHRQVHHPNEIAQNQGYLGNQESGASFWLHCEFLIMRDEKISKSAGHFLRVKSLAERGVHPLVYRFFLLQAHYRSQLEFSASAVAGARAGLDRMLRRAGTLVGQAGSEGRRLAALTQEARFTTGGSQAFLRGVFEKGLGPAAAAAVRRFDEAVSDDLGTPRAIAVLQSVLSDPDISQLDAVRAIATFDLILGLGLLTMDPKELIIRPADAPLSNEQVEALVAERQAARSQRDWERADQVRAHLAEAGVLVQDGDSAETSTWMWQPRE